MVCSGFGSVDSGLTVLLSLSPGMIIFFDWDNKGGSGSQDGAADHAGIVQKVENGIIYAVEGNSGNLCRVNRYPVGQYEIMGYGILRP